MDTLTLQKKSQEIELTFIELFENVDNLITLLKQESSNEILNGSINEAQKLLSKIIPYQEFYKKLVDAKHEFEKIENNSKDIKSDEKQETEEISQKEVLDYDEEISNNDSDETDHSSFRLPILKALIFMGGSSEKDEVIEHVGKEFKGKLKNSDFEIQNGEKFERWILNLNYEAELMLNEGLLNDSSQKNTWEIAQKGIDYLSKYVK